MFSFLTPFNDKKNVATHAVKIDVGVKYKVDKNQPYYNGIDYAMYYKQTHQYNEENAMEISI
jgi:hypothetical protein